MTEILNPDVFGMSLAKEDIQRTVLEVLREGELFRYRDDRRVSWNTRLECSVATWLNTYGAVTTSSGTAALRAALQAVGVRPGSRVLVSAYTFIATAAAVVSLGSVPEPFDITDSLGIDLADLTTRLRSEVAAVIVVHVNGHMADLHQVRSLVTERGIPLIEDACRGFGASCAGRLAGSVGDIGVFSFQQSKQISAGEGGMIVSSDPVLLARCARQVDLGAVRDEFGRPSWDEPEAIFGENHRMTELQAAILSRQLDQLDAILAQQRIGRSYLRSLLKDREIKVLSSEDPDGDSGSHLLIPTDSAELAQEVIGRAARARPSSASSGIAPTISMRCSSAHS